MRSGIVLHTGQNAVSLRASPRSRKAELHGGAFRARAGAGWAALRLGADGAGAFSSVPHRRQPRHGGKPAGIRLLLRLRRKDRRDLAVSLPPPDRGAAHRRSGGALLHQQVPHDAPVQGGDRLHHPQLRRDKAAHARTREDRRRYAGRRGVLRLRLWRVFRFCPGI